MRIHRHFLIAAACACLSNAAWTQSAPVHAEAQELVRIGTVKDVQGQAWLKRGADMRNAMPGTGVQLADKLVTAPASAARISLRDGTELSLGPGAEADLSEYAFNATTQEGKLFVRLLQGSMRVVTGILARVNPDAFRISTPTSVVGVRGTDFIVEVVPEAPRWQPAAGEFNHE
ncbi:MAG TPA: FecR family protein [Hydrogenophaga sp.]|uniref:FecR family protein n=1 Tax=Hydrogenophaga sp. TaxID=1904254 RepID=UPI002B9065C1|nr:FecR family protein [Hydrogenophaga sp.]HMN93795.1 FecR family protein [Hydrogenophaga sp.]HMP09682.1 FecR family protein [Hydrogenophaga sp.]